MPGYVLFSSTSCLNDIDNYIERINRLYAPVAKQMNKEQLKLYACLDWLLDPIFMYSAFTVAKDYLYDGQIGGKIWWIPFGQVLQYLPMFQFELTPYGGELYNKHYLKINKRLLLLSIRHSDHVLSPSFGVDVAGYSILNVKNRLRIDACLSFWSQPAFILRGVSGPIDADNAIGMGFTSNLHLNLLPKRIKDYSINLFAQLGYKTRGYWQG